MFNFQKEECSGRWINKPSFINLGNEISRAAKTSFKRPKMFFIIAIFLATLLFSVGVLATLDVALSNQATDVRDSSTGELVNPGNLTVFVYDALSGGNLVYSEIFNGSIINGSWNVMIGANASNTMPLEFGKLYYIDYLVNNEDINFTDYNGSEVDRQFFYSPLGDISDEDINDATNLTLGEKITFTFGEIIDNILDGWIRITGNLNVTGGVIQLSTENLSNIGGNLFWDGSQVGTLNFTCPSAFTRIISEGKVLGCMQDDEEGSTATIAAALDDCWNTYGATIPTWPQWYITMNNYDFGVDESDGAEWVAWGGESTGNNFYMQTSAASSPTHLQIGGSAGWANTADYRCFIPAFGTSIVADDIIEEGDSSTEVIDTGSDGSVVFTTEGSEVGRFTPEGNLNITSGNLTVVGGRVGIGTSSPQQKLNVIGDANITGNLTLGEKITFTFGEIIDNILDGWIRVTGNLNVTGNVTASYFIGDGSQLTGITGGIWTNVSGTATYDGDANITGNLIAELFNGFNLTEMNSSISSSGGVPTNTISAFNQATCPAGWTLADGTSGTPDLRGIFIRGAGTSESYQMANGDNYTATYGTFQNDSFQQHKHDSNIDLWINQNSGFNVAGGSMYANVGSMQSNTAGYSADGGGEPRASNETAPASYALIYCMKTATDTNESYLFENIGSNVYLINTSHNFGIGTPSPSTKLDVNGNVSLNNTLYVQNNGRVGIGTASPGESLTVAGNIQINGDLNQLVFRRATSPINVARIRWDNDPGVMRFQTQNKDIQFSTNGFSEDPQLFIDYDSGGNVGIGTASPSTTLDVNGTGELLNVRNDSNSFLFVNETSGNVGIGTTSPGALLEISGSLTPTLKLTETGALNPQIELDDSDGSDWIVTNNGGSFSLVEQTVSTPFTIEAGAGGDAFYIKSGGNIGIGTTAPSRKFEVIGDVNITGQLYVGNGTTKINSSGITFNDGTTQTTAAGSGGHTIATVNATNGTNDFIARAKLAFNSEQFNVTDNSSGDFTLIELKTITGTSASDVWHVVESRDFVTESSASFTGIEPGTKYKLIVNVKQNTNVAYHYLRFNDVSTGNLYDWALEVAQNSAWGGADGHSTDNGIAISGDFNTIGAGGRANYVIYFETAQGLDTDAIVNYMGMVTAGSDTWYSVKGGGYYSDVSNDISSVQIETSAETMTGSATLLKLGPISVNVAGSAGGHAIAKINSSGNVTTMNTRTTLAFDSDYFNVTDNSTADFTKISLNTFNATSVSDVWHVVEERTVTDSANFTGLEPDKKYRIIVRGTKSTDGSMGIRFNHDATASSYIYSTHGYNAGGTPEQGSTATSCYFSNHGENGGNSFFGIYEFNTEYGDSTDVLAIADVNYVTAGGNYAISQTSCRKDLSSDLSSVQVVSVGGTFSGEVTLMELGPITSVVPGTSEVTDIWGVVEEKTFSGSSGETFTLTPNTEYEINFYVYDESASPGTYLKMNLSADTANHRYVVNAIDKDGTTSTTGGSNSHMMELTPSGRVGNPHDSWSGTIRLKPNDGGGSTGVWAITNYRAEIDGDALRSITTGEYTGGAVTSIFIGPAAGTINGTVQILKLGPAIVQTDTRMECPGGFTEIVSQGITLGCMQTEEEGAAAWDTATDNCFDTYGGRLPSHAEILSAFTDFSLTDEGDGYEWTNDAQGGNHYYSQCCSGGAFFSAVPAFYSTSVDYRCFIPNVGGEPFPAGVAISVPAHDSTVLSNDQTISTSGNLAVTDSNLTITTAGGLLEVTLTGCGLSNTATNYGAVLRLVIDGDYPNNTNDGMMAPMVAPVGGTDNIQHAGFTYITPVAPDAGTHTVALELARAGVSGTARLSCSAWGPGIFSVREVRNVAGTGDVATNADNTFIGENTFTGKISVGSSESGITLSVEQTSEGNTFSIKDSDGTCLHDPDSGSEVVSCSSDEKLKTAIQDTDSALDEFREIKVKDYIVKSSGKESTGVIAQEIQITNPELVHEEGGELFVEQPNPWKLLKAIQELEEEIEILSNGGKIKRPSQPSLGGDVSVVGNAAISKGNLSTRILFEEEFGVVPIVTATPVGLHDFIYGVSDLRVSGFDIEISQAQSEEVIFNWHAFGEEKVELVEPIVNDTIYVPTNETIPDLVIPIEPPAEDPIENITIPIEPPMENETIINPPIDNETVVEPPAEDPMDDIIAITGRAIGGQESEKTIFGELLKKFFRGFLEGN